MTKTDKIELNHKDPKDFGEHYNKNIIEIYQLYVDSAQRISARREAANAFFGTLHTAIIAGIGLKSSLLSGWISIVFLLGFILCYIWWRLIKSYDSLNTAKFSIIHEIEEYLPISPYNAEWSILKRGNDEKSHIPFSHIEKRVPLVIAVFYLLIFLFLIAGGD